MAILSSQQIRHWPRRRPQKPFMRVAIDGEPAMRMNFPWPYTKTGKINSNYVTKVNTLWRRERKAARVMGSFEALLSVILDLEDEPRETPTGVRSAQTTE